MSNIDTIITDTLAYFNTRLWVGNNNAFYGRIFRNEERDGYVAKITPIYYSGLTNDAIDVLKDDRKDAMCFFDVIPNSESVGMMEKNKVWVMFMVNLVSLYPTYSRIQATEAAKKAVKDILLASFDEVNACISGYTSFAEYNWREAELSDMSPNYLFRFECTSYNTNC